MKPTDISDADKKTITAAYERLHGELWPGHYLSIWISKKGCVMVSHFMDGGDWSKDTVIRGQVNLGTIEQFRINTPCQSSTT
jgi:hypothetical protein